MQWRLFRLRAIWEYVKLERESPSKDSKCRCCGEHRARGQTVCRMLGFERNLRTTLPPYFIVQKTRRGVWVRSWFGIQILSLSSLETALIHQFPHFETEIRAAYFIALSPSSHYCYYYLTLINIHHACHSFSASHILTFVVTWWNKSQFYSHFATQNRGMERH